jgi:hypothetical protein
VTSGGGRREEEERERADEKKNCGEKIGGRVEEEEGRMKIYGRKRNEWKERKW